MPPVGVASGEDSVAPEAKVVKTAGNTDELDRRVAVLMGKIGSLANDIGKASHGILGLEKLRAKYEESPSFGCADDVVPKLIAAKTAVRDDRAAMRLCHVELALLTDTSLEQARAHSMRRRPRSIVGIIAGGEGGESEEEEQWEEDYAETFTRAVVMYARPGRDPAACLVAPRVGLCVAGRSAIVDPGAARAQILVRGDHRG